ncbi:MAG: hypothetical protein LBV27_10210, partial [Oscillospiraceae bacterium]|nr:hypothetical protein [Oscillospiraceae bacterium]
MAEITKVTTPLVPRENIGNKYKPDTDQAFELTDLSKIHKPVQEGKILDQKQSDNQAFLRESMGRAAIEAILKSSGDLVGVIKRMALLVETGTSATQALNDPKVKELLDSLFLSPRQLMDAIVEQDKSAVLFKGETFDILRDLMAKFDGNPKVRDAMANLLKVFEHNINSGSSVKSILLSCENILDYMFTKDREQFAGYLDGLADMLLPKEEAQQGPVRAQEGAQPGQAEETKTAAQGARQEAAPAMSQKEAAQILKSNLLPLLGEIVVKYHQNGRIRDHVMTV